MSRKEKATAVRAECLQTGSRVTIPMEDWNAYTPEQREAYRVIEDAPRQESQEAEGGEVGE